MRNLAAFSDHQLTQRYRELRSRIGRLFGSNYDITNRCNLRCEGCLFFEGEDPSKYHDPGREADWDGFFAAEAQRGVNWGYFAGAEPGLEVGRLRSAYRHIKRGVALTNGTIRIPADIRYRLHVSVWGDAEYSEKLRGVDVLSKAIRNYENDDRVIFIYTVSAQNIDRIMPVATLLAAHGLTMTFNYYSPTISYLNKVFSSAEHDDEYFRFSDPSDNLILQPADFARAHEAIAAAKAAFPDTIVYSLDYDRWVGRPGGIYDIDPATGIARDCGNRLTTHFRHYNADMSINDRKCCSPNIDCKSCRAYAQSYATILSRHREFAQDTASFRIWLEVWELWSHLFLGPLPARDAGEESISERETAEA